MSPRTTRRRVTTPPRPDLTGGRAPAPPCVGLTGGIGSGKSEALAAFARCGAATLSSDEVVHLVYAEPEVRAAVCARFGDGVLDSAGSVDRSALGALAFADDDGLTFLERLVHGRVGQRRRQWIDERRAESPPVGLLVCEVPLLFEVGLEDEFEAVVVITASAEIRRGRVEARGQDFDQRRSRQLPEQEKVARADRAYVNDGDVADLGRWVADRYAEYSGRPCRTTRDE